MPNPRLDLFPPSLARLILCGGGGLPEAYGPLGLTLPLNHWRDRLAIVAAWMLGQEVHHATIEVHGACVFLSMWGIERDIIISRCWTVEHGYGSASDARDLPTLPAHLQTHDPAVALILALYDAPEFRARLEAL